MTLCDLRFECELGEKYSWMVVDQRPMHDYVKHFQFVD
jgi:hypothetical protein